MVIIKYSDKYLPRLNDKAKDPSKIWEIRFYLYNPATDKYEKQRRYISPTTQNKGNYNKRLREANTLKAELRRKMNEGWHIESSSESQKSKPIHTLEESIADYIKFKEKHVEMVKLTKAFANNLRTYMPTLLTKDIQELTKQDCLEFRSLMIERVIPNTCNTYMTVFSTVFNHVIEKEWIVSNPVKKIKHLKVGESNVHYPYTPEQRQDILDMALKLGYKQLYLLLQFVYYTLARPHEELKNLKVGYIREDDIFLPGQNAKNRKNSAVPIAPSLEAIIQEYKLRDYPAEYYVFGKTGEPSQIVQGDIFYSQHRKILKLLNLTDFEDKSYTLYGHKHTGAIALAKNAKDVNQYKMVQYMCRHHSFNQTEVYLRKWGVNLSEMSKDFLL